MEKTKGLHTRAMLVSLNLSMWAGRVRDDEVGEEIKAAKQADKDAGAWWTYLIPKQALISISKAYWACRAKHHKLTLPWNNDGARILPAKAYFAYTEEMRKVMDEYKDEVKKFLDSYDDIVHNARQRLGKLYGNREYPSLASIQSKFDCGVVVSPLPAAEDFRVDLGNEEIQTIRDQIRSNTEKCVAGAMKDLWNQLQDLVQKMVETFSDSDKIFRDTLITNVREFCELIPKMNITEDSNLEQIRKEVVEKLVSLKADDLRISKKNPEKNKLAARKAAAKAAKELLEKMGSYCK